MEFLAEVKANRSSDCVAGGMFARLPEIEVQVIRLFVQGVGMRFRPGPSANFDGGREDAPST